MGCCRKKIMFDNMGRKFREYGISSIRQILLPISFLVFVIAVWEYVVDQKLVSTFILPPPIAVIEVLNANSVLMWEHALSTLFECFIAFICACVLALLISALMTISYWARKAIYPNLIIFQLVPVIALAPLFILWFGVGTEARIAYGVCLALFPIVVSCSSGLLNTNDNYLKLVQSLNAGCWQTFFLVRLPFALPMIFTGLRIGLTLTIIGVVVGEFVTAQQGIGYLISFSASGLEAPIALASIVFLLLVGLILFAGLVYVEFILLKNFSGVSCKKWS